MTRRFLVVAAAMTLGCGCMVAQGTKQWTVGRYDEMERGSTDGVAIRSDGTLEAAPPTSLLYTSSGNYVWSVAADATGNAYVGMGGTTSGSAAVLRVGADGKATNVFSSTELGVQAVRVGPDGAVLVATSPDGKVYQAGKNGGAPVLVFDPASTAEKPKYLWDLAVGANGEVYVAAGSARGGLSHRSREDRFGLQDGGSACAVPLAGQERNALGRDGWGWGRISNRSACCRSKAVCHALRDPAGDHRAGRG